MESKKTYKGMKHNNKMRKEVILMVAVLFLFATMGMVSAKTLVAGKIYNADWSAKVEGATVNVTCDGNSNVTVSSGDGTYAVSFYEDECDTGDSISVYAEKDGASGTNTGIVNDKTLFGLDCNIGVVNVALIPEFGLIAGLVVIIGSLAVFVYVRRK